MKENLAAAVLAAWHIPRQLFRAICMRHLFIAAAVAISILSAYVFVTYEEPAREWRIPSAPGVR